jgi:hypothetical protein
MKLSRNTSTWLERTSLYHNVFRRRFFNETLWHPKTSVTLHNKLSSTAINVVKAGQKKQVIEQSQVSTPEGSCASMSWEYSKYFWYANTTDPDWQVKKNYLN